MNKQNIERIIRELFRQNYKQYPESYPGMENGLISDEGSDAAQEWATNLWNVRNDDEIERDENAAVILRDYIDWAIQEFNALSLEKIQ